MIKSKSRCDCCARAGIVRKCTGCYQVAYCSKSCQKKDWTERHRYTCANTRQHNASATSDSKKYPINKQQTDPEPSTYKIENPRMNTSSPPARTANTANASDQDTEDISLGNAEAPETTAVQTQDEKEKLDKICLVCKSRVNVKSCSGCKGTHYCSKECQRSDWGRHKLVCKEVEGKIETKLFQRHQAERKAIRDDGISPDWHTSNSFGFYPFASPVPFPGTCDSTSSRPIGSFIEVKRTVQRMYPWQHIIDDFDELPSETFFGPPAPTNRVLLAFMTKFYPHPFRRAVYIQDKKGDELYAIFYLEIPTPFPFFSWNDIRPGWYICIEEAFIHGFFDGTVGIRIEDPTNVRILKN